MSGGTPDAAGSGGFWGCTEAACTGLFKKKKKKGIYCCLYSFGYKARVAAGVCPAPAGERWQKA